MPLTTKRGTHEDRVDNTRSKRKRFSGNQFVDNDGNKSREETTDFEGKPFEDISKNTNISYRIIDFFTVFVALSQMLICGVCKSAVNFKQTPLRGLGFKIVVSCRCGDREVNSGPLIANGYEINRRFILVMRLLAVSNEGINLFCNLMDISKGFAKGTYDKLNTHLSKSCKKVFEFCCSKAVKEAVAENEKLGIVPPRNLPVSGDGTWKKRGFSSLFGVFTLILIAIKKCVGMKVKSSFCQECKKNKLPKNSPEYLKWWKNHESECSKNHEGSAGAMEPAAAIELFKESVEKNDVKFPIYVGDGDSSTHKNIVDAKPYGDELIVEKRECVGHVQKRMGTRLRNLKKKENLGGAGKLTDALIKDLTLYYGLAIRRNPNSVEDMKREIQASYFHKISTDEKPRHEFCSTSWCWWKKREEFRELYNDPEYEAELQHDPPLHKEVAEKIWPIYEDLSNDDLLQRCLGGYTQNANESLNSLIWKFAPKHLHSGFETVEIAANLAGCIFNEGYLSILWIMKDLNIEIGERSFDYAVYVNKRRDKEKEKRRSQSTHKARKARKEALEDEEDEDDIALSPEDMLYGPGIAD